MLTWILNLLAAIAGILPTNVWVFLILGGTILLGFCLRDWTTIIKAFGLTVLAYYFLRGVAYFMPNWIETIIVIGLIIAFFSCKKG